MPIYEYECKNCGTRFDRMQPITSDPVKVCPNCGEEQVRRVIQPVGVIFKGSGWYINDSRKSNNEGAPPAHKGEAAGDTSSESKGEDKPDSKPDSKGEGKPDSKPESKGDSKPGSKPESKGDSKPGSKDESKRDGSGSTSVGGGGGKTDAATGNKAG
jgi:putative FmdB family regulatory protein